MAGKGDDYANATDAELAAYLREQERIERLSREERRLRMEQLSREQSARQDGKR